MNAHDLTARGFTPLKAPGAYTYCTHCRGYRWFSWWRAPKFGVSVATCAGCGTVPPADLAHVRMFPRLAQVRTA